MNNCILDAVHQTARELNAAGVMKDITFREFDALCLPTLEVFSPEQIKQLRLDNKASQGIFAAYLNISKSTIQKGGGTRQQKT